MTDRVEIGRVQLPAGLTREDLLSLYDSTERRVAAVLLTESSLGRKGRWSEDEEPAELPLGIQRVTRLPAQIAGPFGRWTDAVGRLLAAHETQGLSASEQERRDLQTERGLANEAVGERWRALESWASAWTHAAQDGEIPGPSEARWLVLQIFPPPEGLRFIAYRPSRQWGAMKLRMKVLATERAQSVMRGFGGVKLYLQLASAHESFGKAYGFLSLVEDPEEPSGDDRPEFAIAQDALREFVRNVESHAEPEEPGSDALSRFLLSPYLNLVSELTGVTSRKRPAKPTPAPAPPV